MKNAMRVTSVSASSSSTSSSSSSSSYFSSFNAAESAASGSAESASSTPQHAPSASSATPGTTRLPPTTEGVPPDPQSGPMWRPWFTHSLVAAACVLLLFFSFLEYRCRRRRQIEAKLHRLSKNRRFYMMRSYILREDFCFPPVLDLLPPDSDLDYSQAYASRASMEVTPTSQLPSIVGIPVEKVMHSTHSGLFVMNLRQPQRRDSRHHHVVSCSRPAVNSTIET